MFLRCGRLLPSHSELQLCLVRLLQDFSTFKKETFPVCPLTMIKNSYLNINDVEKPTGK